MLADCAHCKSWFLVKRLRRGLCPWCLEAETERTASVTVQRKKTFPQDRNDDLKEEIGYAIKLLENAEGRVNLAKRMNTLSQQADLYRDLHEAELTILEVKSVLTPEVEEEAKEPGEPSPCVLGGGCGKYVKGYNSVPMVLYCMGCDKVVFSEEEKPKKRKKK